MRKLSGHLIYSSFTPSSSHHAHLNYFPTPPPFDIRWGRGKCSSPVASPLDEVFTLRNPEGGKKMTIHLMKPDKAQRAN